MSKAETGAVRDSAKIGLNPGVSRAVLLAISLIVLLLFVNSILAALIDDPGPAAHPVLRWLYALSEGMQYWASQISTIAGAASLFTLALQVVVIERYRETTIVDRAEVEQMRQSMAQAAIEAELQARKAQEQYAFMIEKAETTLRSEADDLRRQLDARQQEFDKLTYEKNSIAQDWEQRLKIETDRLNAAIDDKNRALQAIRDKAARARQSGENVASAIEQFMADIENMRDP